MRVRAWTKGRKKEGRIGAMKVSHAHSSKQSLKELCSILFESA